MLLPQRDGIRGIYPLFYSTISTHKILTYWKDHGGEELRRTLFTPSLKLLTLLQKNKFDVIIPIPQHEERSLKRGHASAFEVAKFFSKELKIPLLREFLILKKSSGIKQANLNSWERNYSENPFLINLRLPPTTKKILLVDDFITSGSTLDKAANAILSMEQNCEIYATSLGWKPKLMHQTQQKLIFTKSLTK